MVESRLVFSLDDYSGEVTPEKRHKRDTRERYMNDKRKIPIRCVCAMLAIAAFSGCATRQVNKAPQRSKEPAGFDVPVISPVSIPQKAKLYSSPDKWRYIVIHHSASNTGNAAEFDKFHKKVKKWSNGLGYDFVIGNGRGSGNGQIETGPRWIRQIDGAHAGIKEYNKHGIGICLVGNFEDDRPTENQIASLVSLIRYLQDRFNIPSENVIMHRHVKSTDCPGEHFPYYDILANIRAW